jgi:hypothetical protein
VSWEAWAYLLLALVLVGGFAWYERSRPPARLVALVAALAALAVAGRLVFTPIPNVVATTDIVLIAGYAVGAAPGFAVGALAAVVSNLWLGQGPWTPWEMAGWGLVGLGGAGLATLSRRRLGRLGLAVACGLAGFAYGALLDYSVMVSYGGEQSLDRYLAISARGLPFNVAHAAGNVALALAAGPALVRMISRYRSRFEYTWRAAGAASLAILLALPLALAPQRAQARGAPSAAAWLERAQNGDGGFGPDRGASSSAAMTGWASLGLEAAGLNPLDVRHGGPSAIAYLRANLSGVRSSGDLERTVLALEGAGVNPRRFAGRDLVSELRRRRARNGSFEGQVNLTAFGILALRAAGGPRSSGGRSAAWLRGAENGDGGWGFEPQAASDPDSTGAALQGLAAAGARGAATRGGAAYLRHVQDRDGGFALGGSGASNAQSTAWAIQGLIAAGANPARVRKRGHSPFDYLTRRQAGDGHYRYSSSSDQTPVWVTGQTLVAVEHQAFPLSAAPRLAGHRRNSRASIGSSPFAGAGIGAAAPAGGGGAGPASSTRRSRATTSAGRSRSSAERRAATPRAAERPVSSAAVSADAPAGGGGGGPGTTAYVAACFGVLIAALAGGFVWYRRRLP